MRFYISVLSILCISWTLSSCGPTPPSEQEIMGKIVGSFCTDNYRLEITDSTYRNIKRTPSVMRTGMVRESCKGKFKLEYKDDAWYINYAKDESPNAIFNCKRSYRLWSKEEEYIIGESDIIMKDLFDEQELKKSACD